MQKTRNLFILKGKASDVNLVLESLQFKGLTVFRSSNVTVADILKEFENNKSVACSNLPKEFKNSYISIDVINSSDNTKAYDNCINIMLGSLPKQFLAITKAFDCDIGDYKSNSSDLNNTSDASDCPYCRYFNNNDCDANSNVNKPVYRSKNFVVMPTVGEFIKGYLLIIPIQHVMSMAELSENLQFEFFTVLNDVTEILKLTYPIENVLVWENGTGNGGIGKAKNSIVHSHVHIAPSNLTAEKIHQLSGFPLTKIYYNELSSYGNNSYLLVKDNNMNNAWWYINDNPNLYIPRQYVRQLLAEEYELSGDSWNWRTNPFIYLIEATCKDIQNALINNWSKLPKRIKQNTADFLFY